MIATATKNNRQTTTATVLSESAAFDSQSFTVSIPADTALNTISVFVQAYPPVIADDEPVPESPVGPGLGGIAIGTTTYPPATASLKVYEISIQG